MATDNKPVTAYLPEDIEESLTRYCKEYGIIRKDKAGEERPALGTGVVEILKIFFSTDTLPSPLPDPATSTGLTRKAIEDTVELILKNSVLSKLPSNVVTEEKLNRAIAEVRSEFQHLLDAHNEVKALLGK